MAIDRNITININDTSPLANTAYVDAGKDNKTYNKAQVNELVEDLREGTLGSISPSQTLPQLNALPDGNYYAAEAGDYAFGVTVPIGWQYRFNKVGNIWKTLTKVQIPMQDLTAINKKVDDSEKKVDDFIRDFAVEVDQEFNSKSENPQSGVAVNTIIFGDVKISEYEDITSQASVTSNFYINPITFVKTSSTGWDYLKIPINKGDKIRYTTNGGSSTTGQNIVFQANSNDVITSAIGYKESVEAISENIDVIATTNGYLYFNKKKNVANPIALIFLINTINDDSNLPPITEPSLWGEIYNHYATKEESISTSKSLSDYNLLTSYLPASNRLIGADNNIYTSNNNLAWRNIFVYEMLNGAETKIRVKLSIYANSSPAKTLLAIKTDGSIVSLLDSETEITTLTERDVVIPSDTLFLSVTQRTANLSEIYIKVNGSISVANNKVKNTTIYTDKELLPIKANGQFNWNSYSAHQSNIVVDKLGNEYLCVVDENKYVNVLKKDFTTKQWSVYNFQGKIPNPFGQTIDDNHNVYSISIDDNGYILLTGNMHANNCKSVRSVNPYDITRWIVSNYSTGLITYPRFVKDNNGKVYLFWREGGSGNGDTYYCHFDSSTLTYSSKIKITDGTSVNVNAYEQRIVIDSSNTIHYCYCVRGSGASANTNVGMYYVKSTDGINWTTEKNINITLPITHNINGNRVFNAEVNSGLVNQNGACVDENDYFHTVFWQYREDNKTQIIHLWFDGVNWQSEQLTNYDFRIDLSTGGLEGNLSRPQVIYSKSTNKVYAMYRTNELNEKGQIHFIDVESREKISVGNFNLGHSELQYYQDEDSLKMIIHDMVLKDGALNLKSNKCYLLAINI